MFSWFFFYCNWLTCTFKLVYIIVLKKTLRKKNCSYVTLIILLYVLHYLTYVFFSRNRLKFFEPYKFFNIFFFFPNFLERPFLERPPKNYFARNCGKWLEFTQTMKYHITYNLILIYFSFLPRVPQEYLVKPSFSIHHLFNLVRTMFFQV